MVVGWACRFSAVQNALQRVSCILTFSQILWMQKETDEGAINLTCVKQIFVATGTTAILYFLTKQHQPL